MNTRTIKDDTATLEILRAVEGKSDMTQRHLAEKLDVALGLVNSYLKRCVQKGLVKVHQAPANRYLYYLTPKGFLEKSRLTASYLNYSFNFYREASQSFTDIFQVCEQRSQVNILLFGASELAEIALVRIQERTKLTVVGVCDPVMQQKKYFNYPLWQNIESVERFDACVLTALDQAEPYYDFLLKNIDKKNILVPSILGIKHQ
ncbi:MAG: putative transcriptional regulator [Enterobacterales bacterium]|jgi:predicted transcriptional regulator